MSVLQLLHHLPESDQKLSAVKLPLIGKTASGTGIWWDGGASARTGELLNNTSASILLLIEEATALLKDVQICPNSSSEPQSVNEDLRSKLNAPGLFDTKVQRSRGWRVESATGTIRTEAAWYRGLGAVDKQIVGKR